MVQEKPKAKVDKCCQSGQAEYNTTTKGKAVQVVAPREDWKSED